MEGLGIRAKAVEAKMTVFRGNAELGVSIVSVFLEMLDSWDTLNDSKSTWGLKQTKASEKSMP